MTWGIRHPLLNHSEKKTVSQFRFYHPNPIQKAPPLNSVLLWTVRHEHQPSRRRTTRNLSSPNNKEDQSCLLKMISVQLRNHVAPYIETDVIKKTITALHRSAWWGKRTIYALFSWVFPVIVCKIVCKAQNLPKKNGLPKFGKPLKLWRRGRDLNSWYPSRYTRFPVVLLRPLGHLSAKDELVAKANLLGKQKTRFLLCSRSWRSASPLGLRMAPRCHINL